MRLSPTMILTLRFPHFREASEFLGARRIKCRDLRTLNALATRGLIRDIKRHPTDSTYPFRCTFTREGKRLAININKIPDTNPVIQWLTRS